MKYKLIALDVDGTLINDHYELTAKTKEAVIRANHAGAQIVLCTGRAPQNTLPLLNEMGLEGVMITHNGAATVQSRDNKIMHQATFQVDEIKPFIDYCRAFKTHFGMNSASELYVEELDHAETKTMYDKFMLDPIITLDVLSLNIHMVKVSVFGHSALLDQFEQEWRAMNSLLGITRSQDLFIDIMSKEVSKGSALRQLAEDWGIKQAEIMAIGNYYNDCDMLQYAGLGIAMSNSPESVKLLANDTTGSNNEDGVYQAIMKFCF